MKKITFYLFTLLTPFVLFAQSFPIDFEEQEDNAWGAFNGATAIVVTDPTDASNQVLELTSAGNDFDGASLDMGTYIDLSDDANNTITMEVWAPDANSRTHLLKIEDGNNPPAVELTFTTSMMGWQTVAVDFTGAFDSEYAKITIFMDSTPGNTDTGTYYIDDINGTNGAVIQETEVPTPGTPSTIPNFQDGEVYSIYNDTNNFSTNFPVVYSFGELESEVDLDTTDAVNNAYLIDFGVAGFGQGEGGPDDVSAYDTVSFDYWAEDVDTMLGFRFVLISGVAGSITEAFYEIGTDLPVVKGEWTTVEIPMTFFSDAGFDITQLFQWKVDPFQQSVDNAGLVYLDNILLTGNEISTVQFNLSNINVYPNPAKNIWNIQTESSSIRDIQIFNTLGQVVKTISVNEKSTTIDASELSNGIYFAKMSNDFDNVITIKLIKN